MGNGVIEDTRHEPERSRHGTTRLGRIVISPQNPSKVHALTQHVGGDGEAAVLLLLPDQSGQLEPVHGISSMELRIKNKADEEASRNWNPCLP